MSYAFFFHKTTCSKFADLFCDGKWLPVVCYLADVFEKINTLYVSLQGEGDILTKSEKVAAFQRKLMLWREHLEKSSLEIMLLWCWKQRVSPIKTLTSVHVQNLETEFPNLFRNLPNEEFQWVLNPFVKKIKMQRLLASLQKQLIDIIREDENLPAKFQELLHN